MDNWIIGIGNMFLETYSYTGDITLTRFLHKARHFTEKNVIEDIVRCINKDLGKDVCKIIHLTYVDC